MTPEDPQPVTTTPAVNRVLGGPVLEHMANNPDVARGAAGTGVACTHMFESFPEYIEADVEHVIRNDYNAYIVLGKDRPSKRTLGYGGRGHTQCATIDLVAGRMSADPRMRDGRGHKIHANPDFTKDAARIYISQKTDIDRNFRLPAGKVGSPIAKSGIAIKADGVRIVAREGIKLITGTDARNSRGGLRSGRAGIDLIGNNDESDMQPLVKGRNLIRALDAMLGHMDSMSGIIDSFMAAQMEYNLLLQNHFHISPGFGSPGPPDPIVKAGGVTCAIKLLGQTKMSLVSYKQNLANFKVNYLTPATTGYINSRNNHTN
tara:strand:- start:2164 stop:3117 length:954 start_codon:yes stop_codon:yes gene_type:complete